MPRDPFQAGIYMRSILTISIAAVLLAAIAIGSPTAIAADAPASGAPESFGSRADADLPGAPVRADHRVLFTIRGSVSLPASERAAAIEARIDQAFRDPTLTPENIKVVSTPLAEDIMAGQIRIMRVLPMDGDFETVPYRTVALYYVNQLRDGAGDLPKGTQPGTTRAGARLRSRRHRTAARSWVVGFGRVSALWMVCCCTVARRRQIERRRRPMPTAISFCCDPTYVPCTSSGRLPFLRSSFFGCAWSLHSIHRHAG